MLLYNTDMLSGYMNMLFKAEALCVASAQPERHPRSHHKAACKRKGSKVGFELATYVVLP